MLGCRSELSGARGPVFHWLCRSGIAVIRKLLQGEPLSEKLPFPPARLEAALGYAFRDPDLLLRALTHKSFVNELGAPAAPASSCRAHNERLEFLGDAVLELKVSELLFRRQPEWDEGGLTRMRSRVVNTRSLAAFADRLQLGRYLRLGRGEEKQGGRRRPGLLADAFEALAAALYLDGAGVVVEGLVGELVASCGRAADHKSELQERLQADHGSPPVYRLVKRQGADHRPLFEVEVCDGGGRVLGTGRGSSRKSAEQAAAAAALVKIRPAAG